MNKMNKFNDLNRAKQKLFISLHTPKSNRPMLKRCIAMDAKKCDLCDKNVSHTIYVSKNSWIHFELYYCEKHRILKNISQNNNIKSYF